MWNMFVYNVVFGWTIINTFFRFTEDGFMLALGRVSQFFQCLVNDFDGFVNMLEDNVWTVASVLILWPFYLLYYFFAYYLFGI